MTPLAALVLVLAAGSVCGSAAALPPQAAGWLITIGAGLLVVATRLGWAGHHTVALTTALAAAVAGGIGLGALADAQAWTPPGVDVIALEERVAAGDHVRIAGRLRRDAFVTTSGGVALDMTIDRVWWDGRWQPTRTGARLTVAGERAAAMAASWTRGRIVLAPVASLRRPLPYRNFGVPDAERALARQGLRLFGTIKSAALVETHPGPRWEEGAASVRAYIRAVIARHVDDPAAAAIVTAVLIGDRSTMDAGLTRRLQHAGVYHVVAISGGNVAIWLAVLVVLPRTAAFGTRVGMLWLASGLIVFAAVVDGGASVVRAVLVASVALAARWWDLRIGGLQALAVAAGLQILRDPLAPYDAGCLLSFAAAGTLVLLLRRRQPRAIPRARPVDGSRRGLRAHIGGLVPRVAAAIAATVMATAAIELVLLPISARWFSVATAAGVIANVLAVPAMVAVQIAGLLVVTMAAPWPWCGALAGTVATQAVVVLLRSADVVALAPWLVREVPPPSWTLLGVYYGSVVAALLAWTHARWRLTACCAAVVAGCLASIVVGGRDHSAPSPWTWPVAARWQRASWPREPWLLVTMLDVGQGDATVVRFPSGRTWLVDAGGAASDVFDMGERVTTPALWGLGHRQLSRLLVSHAHPDHAGGVPAVLRRLGARELLTGVPVPGDPIGEAIAAAARSAGTGERRVGAGESLADGPVLADVLHPEPPDWERRRVRNDDSLVVWLRLGEVGFLLTGDVGAHVEQSWAHRFVPAPVTILKLSHHGSASSTGQALLDAVRPALAIGSMGRGNRFGHPAPAVTRRLDAAGVALLRTDQAGAVQVATNGRVALVRTATGLTGSLTASTSRPVWSPAMPLPSDRGSPHRGRVPRSRGWTPSP